MGNFRAFKSAVAGQFSVMQGHQLYRVEAKDALWALYLAKFPAGTNEVYRERTEHDCSCCRNFVRTVGDVVAVIGGRVVSVWDAAVPGEPHYERVSRALSAAVRSAPVKDKFLHYERSAGTDKNFEQLAQEGVKAWEHFFVNIDARFVEKKDKIAAVLAEQRESKNVLLRSLTEIGVGDVTAVLELAAQGSLYRGEEHKFALETFLALKRGFDALETDAARDVFAWVNSGVVGSVARMRNTVIGTLLVDLANGADMEQAVRSYESKVAPANYKRPTALVTKAMVDAARQTVEGLGLTSALRRRYATARDVTVDNLLFVDRAAKRKLEGDVFDDVVTTAGRAKSLDKVEEVGIEKFLADVLPRVDSVEVLFENRHAPNLVSLIAPDDPTSARLFKWDNLFSWSYNGEMADSIKERVKAAGGSVSGDLCCRLAWDYTDDLDFHMHEPTRYSINFTNRRQLSPGGGMLDLDANGADGPRPDPAENIFYADRARMPEGVYTLEVNNYARRSTGRGFTVEVEFDGQVHRIEYDKVLADKKTVVVAKIRYSRNGGFEIAESLPSSQASRQVWCLATQVFHPVSVLLLSPNHWDGVPVGNKHYFFMIDGARNDGNARGFFNEFLREDLSKHRKVLEMVGGKVKVEDAGQQLSGLGFSSTVRNSVTCRVKGSFTRVIKVIF